MAPRVAPAALLLAALALLAAAPARAGAPRGDASPDEALAAGASSPRPGREPSMHTVFSAECTPYFDWQSLALVRSHRKARGGARVLAQTPRDERGGRCHHCPLFCVCVRVADSPEPRAPGAGGDARPDHAPAGVRRAGAEEVRARAAQRDRAQ
jgi:hypothetical protein